ncbi:GNAT family N-acetyltransferase [Paenibacillus sp. J22TS3]|uniref:GNAT family N-acetyltransferase n=1 Tax=Paenibacillus sp. J22TS3 TaxID=2807192 RepID=UPI001B13F2F4|nr:GNAT family N-acetyltransferase [Paenibacillus sp. J22TS3]GIP24689.1 acetyltransferase [Paenibacillus sp. J22TS3]
MRSSIDILELTSATPEQLDELSRLLIDVVNEGASVGFLPPLEVEEANAYWRQVNEPGVKLWAAVQDGRIIGTVQLQLAGKKNALHRAEIAKLMVHPASRRNGLARRLMLTAEEAAHQEGRTLLVLDTREGDPSNLLYQSFGYIEAGRIPGFAMSAGGSLDATVIYYKDLREP